MYVCKSYNIALKNYDDLGNNSILENMKFLQTFQGILDGFTACCDFLDLSFWNSFGIKRLGNNQIDKIEIRINFSSIESNNNMVRRVAVKQFCTSYFSANFLSIGKQSLLLLFPIMYYFIPFKNNFANTNIFIMLGFSRIKKK